MCASRGPRVDFDADYAMVNKISATDYAGACRYSPPNCIGAVKQAIRTRNLSRGPLLSARTSPCACQCPGSARLTNPFSTKFENHCHALALYLGALQLCRVHKKLGATAAMAAGLIDRVIKMTDVVELIDAANSVPAVRSPYKKRETVENSN